MTDRVMLKAIYSFKGSHNDELNFKKGDLITLTQKEEGGWWEGTLDGKTGWFPSNYVKEVSSSTAMAMAAAGGMMGLGTSSTGSNNGGFGSKERTEDEVRAKQIDYRQQVIRDLIDKEREFVGELRQLHKKYLTPLHESDILNEREYRQLVSNVDELIEVHSAMNLDIVETSSLHPREQRLGKIFLRHGFGVRSAHQTYWSNHPKAVCILEKFRDSLDKFMEAQGAEPPGLMVLTTALSKPFRHLEKYPGVSQEIEKHLEDDHPDRGDTQRSTGFFKSVASECAKLRRQKELELEVTTGTIRGWEGDSIISLGDIVHMGSVAVGIEHKDRYLVLFPSHLLILSVSSRMSAFIYEGKLPLSGIAVNRLEDTDSIMNSFEITGPLIERILVLCQSKPDSLKWVEILQQQIKTCSSGNNYAPSSSSAGTTTPASVVHGHKFTNSSPAAQLKRPHNVAGKGYLWKMSCLRPAPPTRSFIAPDDKKKKKDPDTTYEEDMQILRVIESYCTTNRRQTQVNSMCEFMLDDCAAAESQLRNDCSFGVGVDNSTMLQQDQRWRDTMASVDENSRLLGGEEEDGGGGGCCNCCNPNKDEQQQQHSLRDSVNLSGCLPCGGSKAAAVVRDRCCAKCQKKTSQWCCLGVVSTTVKKTTKKF